MTTQAYITPHQDPLVLRDRISYNHLIFKEKNSTEKNDVIVYSHNEDQNRFRYTSLFPEKKNNKNITRSKHPIVDKSTGKICYPSISYYKKAYKESIKSKEKINEVCEEFEEVEVVADEREVHEIMSDDDESLIEVSSREFIESTSPTHHEESPVKYDDSDCEDSCLEDVEEETNEKVFTPAKSKRYNAYEDYKIIQAVDNYISQNGTQGHLSKILWRQLRDPVTQKRLLGGARSAESMRERYKSWLIMMTEDDKRKLRKFARAHTEEEMKDRVCYFRKIDGKRRFIMILKSQTGSSAKKFEDTGVTTTSKLSKVGGYSEEKGEIPQLFVTRPDEMIRERLGFSERRGENKEEKGKVEHSGKSTLKRMFVLVDEGDNLETARKQRVLDLDGLMKKKIEKIPKVELMDSLTWDKERRKGRDAIGGKKLDFSQINLKERFNKGLKEKMSVMKESEEEKESEEDVKEAKRSQIKKLMNMGLDMNLMVYVDEGANKRHYLREKLREEEEESDEDEDKEHRGDVRLKRMAQKYGKSLEEVLKVFKKVSGDYKDLRLFLKTGDEDLLWSEEEDHRLILNKKEDVRVLRNIKGEKRLERRRNYLWGNWKKSLL